MTDIPDILVADDEPAIREGLSALLESEGYSVRTAADGKEAVRLHGERRPDLVLLDVMMPHTSGFVACAEIRRADKDHQCNKSRKKFFHDRSPVTCD